MGWMERRTNSCLPLNIAESSKYLILDFILAKKEFTLSLKIFYNEKNEQGVRV